MLFLTRDKYSGDGEGVMPSRNEQIYSTRMLPADLEEIRTCLRANEKNRATAPLALGLTQQKDSLRYQHAMETAEQKLVCRLKVGNDLEHRFINLHRNCLRLIRQSIILSVDWKLRRQHCATTRSLYRQYWDMFATLSFWQASIWRYLIWVARIFIFLFVHLLYIVGPSLPTILQAVSLSGLWFDLLNHPLKKACRFKITLQQVPPQFVYLCIERTMNVAGMSRQWSF
mmetsp:Transcript_1055/g.3136  ORF Transcript_1055/g.3136 Transcript_1055/m.3136 type:complete len:228 (+) Transcript_1055:225-908(+)